MKNVFHALVQEQNSAGKLVHAMDTEKNSLFSMAREHANVNQEPFNIIPFNIISLKWFWIQ